MNVVIVTSKIITSTNKLSYCDHRSIYSSEQRWNDTLLTITSIRKHIPDSFIIFVDNSKLSDEQNAYLKNNVNEFININDELYKFYTDECIYKACGELYQISIALRFIKNKAIRVKNLFKITGRYVFNDHFDINKYNNTNNVFAINKNVKNRKYYYTCFYKIHTFDIYQNVINKIIGIYNSFNFKNYRGFSDLEVILPQELKFNFQLVSVLGVTQNISVWDEKTEI
jgi:hypothetical protein